MGFFKSARKAVSRAVNAFFKASSPPPFEFDTWEETAGIPQPVYYAGLATAYRRSPWCYACVNAISSAGASLKPLLFEQYGKNIKKIDKHPILDLLKYVNAFSSLYDLLEATYGFLELTGNCYWELVGSPPSAIYVLPPERIKILPHAKKYVKGYIYEVNNKEIVFNASDVVHFKYWNPFDEFYGYSPVETCKDAIEADYYATTFNKNFFIRDASPKIVLESDDIIEEPEMKRLKAVWNRNYGGVKKSHGIAVLQAGLKLKEFGISPKDMQFGELQENAIMRILASYGVPPIKVGILKWAAYATAEIQDMEFWGDTMLPKILKVESCINENLLPIYGLYNHFIKFDVSKIKAIQRMSDSNSNAICDQVDRQIISTIEAREKLDMETEMKGNPTPRNRQVQPPRGNANTQNNTDNKPPNNDGSGSNNNPDQTNTGE